MVVLLADFTLYLTIIILYILYKIYIIIRIFHNLHLSTLAYVKLVYTSRCEFIQYRDHVSELKFLQLFVT